MRDGVTAFREPSRCGRHLDARHNKEARRSGITAGTSPYVTERVSSPVASLAGERRPHPTRSPLGPGIPAAREASIASIFLHYRFILFLAPLFSRLGGQVRSGWGPRLLARRSHEKRLK